MVNDQESEVVESILGWIRDEFLRAGKEHRAATERLVAEFGQHWN